MVSRMLRWVVALALMTCGINSARAQLIYEFIDPATSQPITSINATTGVPVSFNVVIRDQSVGATTFNALGGLGSGGFRLRYDNPSGIATITAASSITHFTGANGGPWELSGAPQFQPNVATATHVNVLVGMLNQGALPDSNGRIRIAQVTMMPMAVGTTTLQLLDNPSSSGDTASFNTSGGSVAIYDGLFNSPTLSFTVVPEPTTLLGAGLIGLIAYRRLRRQTL